MVSAHMPVFEAIIVPYRSLTVRGMVTMVVGLLALSVAISLRFWLLGAWPVVVFSALEVPLVVLLLALNLRQARASEVLILNAHEFTVVRTEPSGRQRQTSLPAAWLRIALDAEKGNSRLVLSSHGRNCEVGAFLHEPDKVSLFNALSEAVYRVRNPRFENPQCESG